jgi:hypothetical protein
VSDGKDSFQIRTMNLKRWLEKYRETYLHTLATIPDDDINSLAITISFFAYIMSVNVNNVTVGNRETNLVSMVAVKANSVKLPFDSHTHITC